MTTSNLESTSMNPEAPSKDNHVAQVNRSNGTSSRAPGVPIIRVFGVGGGGCNAVSRMCRENLGVVDYYGVNTDSQHLVRSTITHRIPIGQGISRGLGAGGNPELGKQAAEQNYDEITHAVSGADMIFIAAGMGGGTGTGAAPVVAKIAKDSGALTVGVVSRPFAFEGPVRRKNAELGISNLKENVDTLLVIPNDRLHQLDNHGQELLSWEDALKLADSVLMQGIQAIAEVVTVPGEINVDFADVKTVMSNAGPAWLAIGHGQGENRAADAAQMAVKSPLLDIVLEGARRILFVITGGNNLTIQEVQEAANVIQEVADPDANIIFGTCKDPSMEHEVKVTLVASAFPVTKEVLEDRHEDLHHLLRETPTEDNEELDVPSFLRKQSNQKKKRFFR